MLNANVTITADKDHSVIWNRINWPVVNEQVNNLRRRIYRASVEGDMKLVGNLQKLMLKSKSNRLSAIRRVTQVNQGKNSPGIDKVVVNTDKDRNLIIRQLVNNDPTSVKAIKRVYIPKKGGKTRPLGLPTILDRCRQAVVKSALEPYWEAKFEGSSYGFRPGRSAQDAVKRTFLIASPGKSRTWVLDADIKGAFDNIDHNFLLKTIGNFPSRKWVEAWLKSGVMEGFQLSPTTAGTPQGGVLSPLLANIALHGMEESLGISFNAKGHITTKSEYALTRYADDFVVFAKSKESCLQAKLKIQSWLAIRGLELSETKTKILHIEEGFNFLGFNIRHYKTESKKKGVTFLCKPSKESVKSFKKRITLEWKKGSSWTTERIIANLNSKLIGWGNYFNSGVSGKTFNALDSWMWTKQLAFVKRRHPKKSTHWLKEKYWGKVKGRNDRWVFMDKNSDRFLHKLSWIPVRRHVIVRVVHLLMILHLENIGINAKLIVVIL